MSRKTRQTKIDAQPDLFAVRLEEQTSRAITSPDATGLSGGSSSHHRSDRETRQATEIAADDVGNAALPTSPKRSPHLLDVRAAAAWLGLSKSTLDKMRCYGVGPRFIRATGRAVRYDPADLTAFAEGRRQSRTTDEFPA